MPLAEVEVDQSGKIEDLGVDTVLAFSNGLSRTIRLPASIKRVGLDFLRRRGTPPKTRYLRMLAAGLYLLLREDLSRLAFITVDVEFAGREGDLQGMLMTLIWRDLPRFPGDRLAFYRIGRRSPAHHLALETYRGRRPPDKVVTEAEFIERLK